MRTKAKAKSVADFGLGDVVIVRTYLAGVHVGTLVDRNGQEVVLKDARRLWRWKGAFTLSEAATKGVAEESRISAPVETILLTQAIEVIPVTEAAAKESLCRTRNT